MTRMFVSRPEYYDRDKEKAVNVRIAPGRLTKPDGSPEKALALFSQNKIVAVLPAEEAYRLATDIANILTDYRQQASHRSD